MAIRRDAHEALAIRIVVWVSMALVLADLVAYAVLLRAQGAPQPDAFTVPFVAGYLVLMVVLLRMSLFDGPRLAAWRPALRGAAAAGLALLGFFAMFSIGLPILIGGVLAGIAALSTLTGHDLRTALLSEIAAAVVAVTILVGGFEVTQRLILCPSSGTISGSSPGFFTGGFHYECTNGTLTMHSGFCNGGGGSSDANGGVTVTSNC